MRGFAELPEKAGKCPEKTAKKVSEKFTFFECLTAKGTKARRKTKKPGRCLSVADMIFATEPHERTRTNAGRSHPPAGIPVRLKDRPAVFIDRC